MNKQAKLYKNIVTLKTRKSIQSAKHMQHEWKKGIHVGDLDDINILSKIGHYGKIAGRGFIAFSIALGVDDVYDTYKNGGDVWGEVGKEVVEVVTAIGLGIGCTVLATPVGWVAVAVTAVVEGTIIAFSSYEAGKWGKGIGDEAHKLFDWSEKYIEDWL